MFKVNTGIYVFIVNFEHISLLVVSIANFGQGDAAISAKKIYAG